MVVISNERVDYGCHYSKKYILFLAARIWFSAKAKKKISEGQQGIRRSNNIFCFDINNFSNYYKLRQRLRLTCFIMAHYRYYIVNDWIKMLRSRESLLLIIFSFASLGFGGNLSHFSLLIFPPSY